MLADEQTWQLCFVDDNNQSLSATVYRDDDVALHVDAGKPCVIGALSEGAYTLAIRGAAQQDVSAPNVVHVRSFAPGKVPATVSRAEASAGVPASNFPTLLFSVNECEGCNLDGVRWPKLGTDARGRIRRGFVGRYDAASFVASVCEGDTCELGSALRGYSFQDARFDRSYLNGSRILFGAAASPEPLRFARSSFVDLHAAGGVAVLRGVVGADFRRAHLGALEVPSDAGIAANRLEGNFRDLRLERTSPIGGAALDVETYKSLLEARVPLLGNWVELRVATELTGLTFDGSQNELTFSVPELGLRRTVFAGAHLAHLRFPDGTDLSRSDFSGVHLFDVRCARCSLQGGQGTGIDFTEVTLPDADLRESYLSFANADLLAPRSRMEATTLQLPEDDTSRLMLDDVEAPRLRVVGGQVLLSARRAVLSGASFTQNTLLSPDFTQARIDATDFAGATFQSGLVADVRAVGASFRGARLVGTRLRQVTFVDAIFDQATCEGCVLESSEVCGGSAFGLRFESADLFDSMFGFRGNIVRRADGRLTRCAEVAEFERVRSDADTLCADGSPGPCALSSWWPNGAIATCCQPGQDPTCQRATRGSACSLDCACASLECTLGGVCK
jgi:uncharacterized protein YjbI with pentapeptide repeats